MDDTLRVGLGQVLEESARRLLERGDEQDVDHTLRLIVRGAIHTVPHVEQAGISLVERNGRIESHEPSSELVASLDRLQNELGEGPCLDAIWHERRTVVEDMGTAYRRWPRWAPAAQERGIGSLLAFQLFATQGSAGALNLYAEQPGAFDEDTTETGALFASQAALVLHAAQRVSGLNLALSSRDVIGQAKGVLMERFGVGQARAFAMLVESSQQTNMKLVEVATWLANEVEQRGARNGPGPGHLDP